jgi:hypothetical protein
LYSWRITSRNSKFNEFGTRIGNHAFKNRVFLSPSNSHGHYKEAVACNRPCLFLGWDLGYVCWNCGWIDTEHQWMMADKRNRNSQRIPCPCLTLFATNPIRAAMGAKSSLRCGNSVNKCLRYGMSPSQRVDYSKFTWYVGRVLAFTRAFDRQWIWLLCSCMHERKHFVPTARILTCRTCKHWKESTFISDLHVRRPQ